MKLLELIVKSVKRENIHPEAKFFAQDWLKGGSKVLGFEDEPEKYDYGWSWCGYINGSSLNIGFTADDSETTIITREELMRAYDLVEQGYTLWFGGDCPVYKGVFVDVVLRSGETFECGEGKYWFWSHCGGNPDIIAYKLTDCDSINLIFDDSNSKKSDEIIRLISSVAPNITLSDALEIADTLIDAGYRK